MPTSSLQQTNDAAAMSATASDCVPPNEVADTHVATLLITVTFVVVAGVTERAVLAVAMSTAIRQTVRARCELDEGATRKGTLVSAGGG